MEVCMNKMNTLWRINCVCELIYINIIVRSTDSTNVAPVE
jgi:hypothetical protein